MANTPELDQNFRSVSTASSQPTMKLQLTPGADDFTFETDGGDVQIAAKAIAIHTANGGRARIVYIPKGNDDDQVVDIVVYDGWTSDTAVRRVTTLTALAQGDSATLWGLFN